jgi:hypothetical protein
MLRLENVCVSVAVTESLVLYNVTANTPAVVLGVTENSTRTHALSVIAVVNVPSEVRPLNTCMVPDEVSLRLGPVPDPGTTLHNDTEADGLEVKYRYSRK